MIKHIITTILILPIIFSCSSNKEFSPGIYVEKNTIEELRKGNFTNSFELDHFAVRKIEPKELPSIYYRLYDCSLEIIKEADYWQGMGCDIMASISFPNDSTMTLVKDGKEVRYLKVTGDKDIQNINHEPILEREFFRGKYKVSGLRDFSNVRLTEDGQIEGFGKWKEYDPVSYEEVFVVYMEDSHGHSEPFVMESWDGKGFYLFASIYDPENSYDLEGPEKGKLAYTFERK